MRLRCCGEQSAEGSAGQYGTGRTAAKQTLKHKVTLLFVCPGLTLCDRSHPLQDTKLAEMAGFLRAAMLAL